jgi:hypothetical protein
VADPKATNLNTDGAAFAAADSSEATDGAWILILLLAFSYFIIDKINAKLLSSSLSL